MSLKMGLEPRKYVWEFEYDFAKEGGAVGTINLRGGKVPVGGLVTDGKIFVETAMTSGGAATMSLGINSAVDILAATGKASFSLAALLDVVPIRTAATSIRVITTAKLVYGTVATAALTAGKFRVMLEGYLSG